jgi:mycothiol synthase
MDPGKTIRIDVTVRPATMDDAEAVAYLFNACSLDVLGKPRISVEELRSDWQVPGFDLAADTHTVWTRQDRLIGYADLWGKSANCVRFTPWVRVHPEFRGYGIGSYLNEWAESRAREEVVKAPEGARVVLETFAPAADTAARELLRARGMIETRHSWEMEIQLDTPPPAPKWPEGITVRPRSPGDERAFYEVENEAFKDHYGYVEEPFEVDFPKWKHLRETEPHYDPSLWFLAEEPSGIAGFAICSPETTDEPDMGWVWSLGVLRPWRRRGLGLALLLHCFGEFFRRKIPRAGLSVDAESLTGATRLYEKAGMHVTHEHIRLEKELRPGRDLSTGSL